jgi:hypothetical protein
VGPGGGGEGVLGWARYQRRAEVDALPGYRNGYGKPRKLTTPLGTVTLRRPRVRGLEERFVSRILPLFARRTSGDHGMLLSCSRACGEKFSDYRQEYSLLDESARLLNAF